MESDAAVEDPPPTTRPRVPRPLKFVLLGAGLLVALYFGSTAPREQHVRIVLGERSPAVTSVGLQYVAEGAPDDVARETRLAFPEGAPRIVAHDPALADGDYRLRIDLDTRQGRRSAERRVRLGGGSTQIDLTADVAASMSASPSP